MYINMGHRELRKEIIILDKQIELFFPVVLEVMNSLKIDISVVIEFVELVSNIVKKDNKYIPRNDVEKIREYQEKLYRLKTDLMYARDGYLDNNHHFCACSIFVSAIYSLCVALGCKDGNVLNSLMGCHESQFLLKEAEQECSIGIMNECARLSGENENFNDFINRSKNTSLQLIELRKNIELKDWAHC